MFIIRIEANANGSRPPMQSWNNDTAPEGFALVTDAQKDVFYSTTPAGFVNITVKEENGAKVVDTIEVNQEALDAYKATLPDPTDSIKAEKIDEIKKACEDYIYAGTDVTYADGARSILLITLLTRAIFLRCSLLLWLGLRNILITPMAKSAKFTPRNRL